MTGQSLREQKRNFTRSRLIKAAAEIFEEKGYLAATIDDIVRASGASRATFYLHFSGKNEIALEILEQTEQYGVARYSALDELLATSRSAKIRRARLRDWLADWLGYWRRTARLRRALDVAIATDPDIERRALAMAPAFIDSLATLLNTRPPAKRADTRNRILLMEAMTRRVFALASTDNLPMTDEQTVDYVTEHWATILLTGPSARNP